MSIKINSKMCIGCCACIESCPGNLIEIIENKAEIRQVKDCWGCTACAKSCPVNAIGYYLGADIGGSGSLLYVKDKGEILEWIIDKVNEKKEKIIVCKSDSNQY